MNKCDKKVIAYLEKQKEKKKVKACVKCDENENGFCNKEKLWCTNARKYCEIIKEIMKSSMTLGQYWKNKREREKKDKLKLLQM